MELKLTKESICINEVVFDGTLEQAVELDYLLPDYCPSIFKVLKCRILPKITSERIMNGKLLVDGTAYIKIIYVCEESYRIRSITQKQAFSKSMELKDNYSDGVVSAGVKCDYVNCRVVNQRRLDIRGAISMKATVSAVRKLDVLCGASGMGIQVNTQNVTALDKKLYASKEFSVKEELELAYGKPPVSEVLDHTASAILTDYKLIANKVVLKGEILFHTLYCPVEESSPTDTEQLQIMDYTIPISQIVDLPGVSEDYQCVVSFDVTSVELNLKQNNDGVCTCFDAEFGLRACCEADRNAETQLINDIYSTGFEVQSEVSRVKIEQLVSIINESCICKHSVSIPQGEMSCVYDICCDFSGESCKVENGCILISGNLDISILALDNDCMPVLFEKSNPCEMKIEARCADSDVMFSPNVTIASVSYSLVSGSEIEVRAELKVCGSLYRCCYYEVVGSVNIDETCRKEHCADAVLRLYYAQRGERVWEIAKRYSTSVDAIVLENNLESDTLPSKSMLLIPMIE